MGRERRRIAVVGAGIAGLTAAYVLREADDVTVYEADERLGGHAHTHELTGADGVVRSVDSGFIVHNERTYPRLLRLFAELGVETQESEMSMSVRCEGCGLEYAGALGPRGLFAQPRNVADLRFVRMLTAVTAFHRRARALLADGGEAGPALGEFLDRHGFSPYFVQHFAIPLVSAVWSCAPGAALEYPARYLFRFLEHHGMLSVSGSPVWRTVTGGSRAYVDVLVKELPDVRTSAPVRRVVRTGSAVHVTSGAGSGTASTEVYDAVVIAVHPGQALAMLADASADEQRVLGAFPYSANPAVLHTDTSLLPKAPGARASWNYLLPECGQVVPRGAGAGGHVRVSYDMNRLQRLDAPERYVVTLGDEGRVDPDTVLARMAYEHPVYTPESVAAQKELPTLGGERTVYAGAYHGWGFHEDGCRSGVLAAERLGVAW
ncbi:NAD(P)/FAD-dependent oxidoreductase [Streptomyces albidoflavus]|uniref:NAD(P)/FAD-dependent oxidoreductase n=1 Tax=Streptomyces albidoflavus TaxID=1886 RepID=UPI0004C7A731|nr:FAD-dependent oxidoreductase [Streptomyces albidoflavus]